MASWSLSTKRWDQLAGQAKESCHYCMLGLPFKGSNLRFSTALQLHGYPAQLWAKLNTLARRLFKKFLFFSIICFDSESNKKAHEQHLHSFSSSSVASSAHLSVIPATRLYCDGSVSLDAGKKVKKGLPGHQASVVG